MELGYILVEMPILCILINWITTVLYISHSFTHVQWTNVILNPMDDASDITQVYMCAKADE